MEMILNELVNYLNEVNNNSFTDWELEEAKKEYAETIKNDGVDSIIATLTEEYEATKDNKALYLINVLKNLDLDVFAIYTDDGTELNHTDLTKALDSDIVIYEKDIKNLVETELDEDCHEDFVEDYNSPIEFYLSNAEREDYKAYIQSRFDETRLFDDILYDIQEEVIRRITEAVNLMDKYI